ncbi:MAG: GNAT family N-acetyltransferase [Bdellovibrionaceae bacterium]|nr:GNAT family N-acetyltransferase [Pseudobdellovibrionaceae bacterium]
MKVLPWEKSSISKENLIELFFKNSSKKEFSSQEEKLKFLDCWFNIYLDKWPENVLVALSPKNEFMGYLLGCFNSQKALPILKLKISSYSIFEEHFYDFPAHLHVNVSNDFQGQGVGKKLIEYFQNMLKENSIQGLHAITSSDASNIQFYAKLGFLRVDEKPFKNWNLVFMGKKLFDYKIV